MVYKTFNTERVMRWRLIIEECGPKLTHIKGENNIVADALSRMRLTEKDFSAEAFAGDANANDFPTEHPLSYKQIAHEQVRAGTMICNQGSPKNQKSTRNRRFATQTSRASSSLVTARLSYLPNFDDRQSSCAMCISCTLALSA